MQLDPLETAAQIVKGYHAAHPLTDDELGALFGLVCMRLCMSACIAAEQHASQPGQRLSRHQPEAYPKDLPKLAAIHPRLAQAVFRRGLRTNTLPGQ